MVEFHPKETAKLQFEGTDLERLDARIAKLEKELQRGEVALFDEVGIINEFANLEESPGISQKLRTNEDYEPVMASLKADISEIEAELATLKAKRAKLVLGRENPTRLQ